jgi:hypothetical protein
MAKAEQDLTHTQRLWLARLHMSLAKRLRFGGYGIPEQTAKALERRGLVRIEMQRIRRKEGRSRIKAYFVVLVEKGEQAGNAKG